MRAGGLFLEPYIGSDSQNQRFNGAILHWQATTFSNAFDSSQGRDIHEGEFLCIEKDGRDCRKYLGVRAPEKHSTKSRIRVVNTTSRSRITAHFFGGTISVFTTHSLLHALGVSSRGTSSIAINWVIKDGAGRIGKLLFARKGKKFDCDLKQLRFAGHILMEVGALVELATARAPSFFLPLACVANVVKNIAAVSSTSTRAPIYKAFAIRENIGDITAKGECTSNIADLLGTGLGILISGKNQQTLPMFLLLSCGYIFASYREVKAVILPTLNQARFGVAVRHFLSTGQVPSVSKVNSEECIFTFPWAQEMDIELGACVADAFQDSRDFLTLKAMFQDKRYLITFSRRRKRAFVVLKEAATSQDVMEGAFQGWIITESLLNPGGARLCVY